MVLFLHNRYRTMGGEERVVDELLALVRDRLGEPVELLERDSAELGRGRAAAGLLRGGLAPRDVGKAVRITGARVVHAHNLNPLFGWRALAAARAEGALVVLHLHQYRLVCATGVCFTGGKECTRCHGRNTLPGVIHNCRGSRSEALAYGASLALWQRRLLEQADALIVPSVFALERLRKLGRRLSTSGFMCSRRRSTRRARTTAWHRSSICESEIPALRRGGATPSWSRGWPPRRASMWRSTPAGWLALR